MTVSQLIRKYHYKFDTVILVQEGKQLVCCSPKQLNKFELRMKVIKYKWDSHFDMRLKHLFLDLRIEVKE